MHIAHCTAALHTENEWPGKPTFFLGKKNLAIASGWSHVGWAGINYGYGVTTALKIFQVASG